MTAAMAKMRSESLHSLLGSVPAERTAPDMPVSNLCLDSRKARSGSLYFALPGSRTDGREHVRQAIDAGATAVLYEAVGAKESFDDAPVPCIPVANLRRYVGKVADIFYREPSKHVHIVGITGTNGKTTTAWICASALNALGLKSEMIGTLGIGDPHRLRSSPVTTPDPVALHAAIRDSVARESRNLCLEVSSHALEQDRTAGIRFDTVVFTNLTPDHLDYHGAMQEYQSAKEKLFTSYPSQTAVVNADDEFGRRLAESAIAEQVITYGQSRCDVRIEKIESGIDGIEVDLSLFAAPLHISSRLVGSVNAINLAASAAIMHALRIAPGDIESALSSVMPPPGRMEKLSDSPATFIDFAHTPDALEHALKSVNSISSGKVWVVFGCGGSRDAAKRPVMGKVAESNADVVILTDDNPRDEDPQAIVEQIAGGMSAAAIVNHDRESAICHAVLNAGENDAVLVAGKGHETTQTYGQVAVPFEDRTAVMQALGERK